MAQSFLILSVLLIGALAAVARAQNCGCSSTECCSRWGFCGNTPEHCGAGCQNGPCNTNSVQIADVVTPEFFSGIIDQSENSCAGKSFYSREVFLRALESYSGFARVGSEEDSKREIAAFFAHATHETGHFCYIEEIDGPTRDYCDEENTQYPCNPSKGYYGRGPLQLSWNFNYGPAGEDIGFDGVNSPETVANDPLVAFKSALWFWMNNVQQVMVQGFGATIRAINGNLECDGGNSATVSRRAEYYSDYCRQLGVAPGDNLTC
ncbi:Endochitinase EP3 [Linum grandiflorum]